MNAGVFADALVAPRYCIGCGRDERIPFEPPAVACCPEMSFATVSEIITVMNRSYRRRDEAITQITELRQEVKRLQKKLDEHLKPEPPEPPWLVQREPRKKLAGRWKP